jgi:hypothetical protein
MFQRQTVKQFPVKKEKKGGTDEKPIFTKGFCECVGLYTIVERNEI